MPLPKLDLQRMHFKRRDTYLCVGGAAHGQMVAIRDGSYRYAYPSNGWVASAPQFACQTHDYKVIPISDSYDECRYYLVLAGLDLHTTTALLRDLGEMEDTP